MSTSFEVFNFLIALTPQSSVKKYINLLLIVDGSWIRHRCSWILFFLDSVNRNTKKAWNWNLLNLRNFCLPYRRLVFSMKFQTRVTCNFFLIDIFVLFLFRENFVAKRDFKTLTAVTSNVRVSGHLISYINFFQVFFFFLRLWIYNYKTFIRVLINIIILLQKNDFLSGLTRNVIL